MTSLIATTFPAAVASLAPPAAAQGALSLAWLLVAIPLAGAGVLLLLGRRADTWGHWLGVLASASSFVVGLVMLIAVLGRAESDRVLDLHLFRWLPAGTFHLDAGLRIDPLSLTFVLLVTLVGTLIHVYAVAYMEHDDARRRFFSYLNLFVAAMLLLVLADSYLLLFVGWEGVGLVSYLLIGFWFHETPNAVAAKKAFIANRIGDVGLLIALMLMFATFGSVDFATVLDGAHTADQGTLTAVGLMLLLAACGKSAQFPLQSWLGDAMAGPTPVSALIHAATMVTAGVYLVVRSGPVFEAAPDAQLVVVIVGAITLLYGAIVGCAKDDIKKALAASTMSQIGYMILAAGLGPIGYAFAIFHLVTHGFFKAGLFLGAGSVMHGMNDKVNMREFGGLWRTMKVTWITFAIGWWTIIGLPPFSGFFSKDKIIEAAFVGEGWRPWTFGLVTLLGAGITAFYMSRVFFMTFHGDRRWNDGHSAMPDTAVSRLPVHHPHESPKLMTVPMIVLAIGSVLLGGLLSIGGVFTKWLEPVTGHAEEGTAVLPPLVITMLTLVLVLAGLALAWFMYARSGVPAIAPAGSVLVRAARKDLYQDEVNDGLLVEPGKYLTRSLVFGDRQVVDGAVGGLGHAMVRLGAIVRRSQTGYVRSYAATMTIGVVALVAVVLATRI
ncbi:NADH-quinone oxidoreductase subunit L [Pengzhenrongella sp.]|uniref:NADH-quinone oxidoreductase subunit L n=1 Tax=Pengzhenrongella sp. TaxID=2888820 RepID=UPI0039C9485B